MNPSALFIVIVAIMAITLVKAFAHRIVFRDLAAYYRDYASCSLRWAGKLAHSPEVDDDTLLDRWLSLVDPKHPEFPAIKALSQISNRKGFLGLYKQHLEERVARDFRALEQSAALNKSVAPTCGLFFTMVGMFLALYTFHQGADERELLGQIAIALVSTMVGAASAIMEQLLINGRLRPLRERFVDECTARTEQLVFGMPYQKVNGIQHRGYAR